MLVPDVLGFMLGFLTGGSILGNQFLQQISLLHSGAGGNVLIRVDASFVADFHIDADEANAAGLKTGDHVYIIKKEKTAAPAQNRRLITENDVRQARLKGRKIKVPAGAIITPAARDMAKAHDVFE